MDAKTYTESYTTLLEFVVSFDEKKPEQSRELQYEMWKQGSCVSTLCASYVPLISFRALINLNWPIGTKDQEELEFVMDDSDSEDDTGSLLHNMSGQDDATGRLRDQHWQGFNEPVAGMYADEDEMSSDDGHPEDSQEDEPEDEQSPGIFDNMLGRSTY